MRLIFVKEKSIDSRLSTLARAWTFSIAALQIGVERLLSKGCLDVILATLALISPVLGSLISIVMLVSLHLRAECQVLRPVVPQLLLDLLHVFDLVWCSVRAWANRLIVLDTEVDS